MRIQNEKNQEKIIELLKQTPDLTLKEISENINISITSVSNNLKKLTNKGFIERIGADKNGYWKILK